MSLLASSEKISIDGNAKPEVGSSGFSGDSAKNRERQMSPILAAPLNYDKRAARVNERFIKYIPSEKSSWLRQKYPFAFLLLSLIAERATRTSNNSDGREIGEAFIGDWKAIGASRQQYRTALKVLTDIFAVAVVDSNRTNHKATTTPTTTPTTVAATRGTKVKILKSDIWDLNLEYANHSSNQTATNSQPQSNHEQECKEREERKKKRLKEKLIEPKIEIREKVRLTINQHETLLKDHGEEFLSVMLDELNSYKAIHGKEYDSDYHTMIGAGWVLKKCRELRQKPTTLSTVRDEILKRFENGKFYNGAECFIDDFSISFQRGMNHKQLKFKEFGFWDQFQNILTQFSIKQEAKL